MPPPLPDRRAALAALAGERFDLLIAGGGCTGLGLAVEAAAAGLRTALVEREDFGSGTSSRSTKLLHGGVRYLERAFTHADADEYRLVREALAERAALFRLAPHLAARLRILTPCADQRSRLYYEAGLRLYDLLAGRAGLGATRWLGPAEASALFPGLPAAGRGGGVLYSDGQFDDARLCVLLAVTAAELGATVANYVRVAGLVKENGAVVAAEAEDLLGGARFAVRARTTVNAAGPFADGLAALDDPGRAPALAVSAGTHVVVGAGPCPPDTGLLVPRTIDGRVVFVLPWLGRTLIGTTDAPAEPSAHPEVPPADVRYLLGQVNPYLAVPLRPEDVRSQWSGLRPLARGAAGSATAALSRRHAILQSPSGLVTVVGGKWTTYRRAAAAALAHLDRTLRLGLPRAAGPREVPVAGAAAYSEAMVEALGRRHGLAPELAGHLGRRYGDRMAGVCALIAAGHGARLVADFPYVEAEVLWGTRHEMARTVMDVLGRRTRLAFLDRAAAVACLPRVAQLMAAELGWDGPFRQRQEEEARARLAGAL